jgi:hypothetical protein
MLIDAKRPSRLRISLEYPASGQVRNGLNRSADPVNQRLQFILGEPFYLL